MPVKPNKLRHSEDEMRLALTRLHAIDGLKRDDDDPLVVMEHTINEVLHARQLLEEMRGVVEGWRAKLTRREGM